MPDNGKNIEKAKQKAIDALNAKADQMSKVAYDVLLQAIENTFDIKAGQIEAGKDFIKQLNKLTVEVLDLLQSEPKFTGPVSGFVKRLYDVSDAITDFQKNVNDIKVPSLSVEKKIVIDEVINQFLDNGLNQNFVTPLRDLIYQNVTGGLSLAEAKAQLKQYIVGGNDVSGKLGKYLEQTAQQATDMYSGIINKSLMEEFKYDALLMTGTLIDNSSPQCRYVYNELNGKLTKDKWPEFEKIAKKNGLIKGTTFETLPLNKAHWNCRHGWYPIILKKTA